MIAKSSIAAVWLAAAALYQCSTASAANPCVVLSSAPDTHLVKQGDTLWDIAARFLQNPWCWRDVWSSNKEQIHDPHWIYPGQQIVLDRTLGTLRAERNRSITTMADKLSPTVRVIEAKQTAAIPTVDPKLTLLAARYHLLSAAAFAAAPRILSLEVGRRLLTTGDIVLATKPPLEGEIFDVMRALSSPGASRSGASSARPMLRIGQVRRQQRNPEQFLVVHVDSELSHGDIMLPMAARAQAILVPHAAPPLEGKIVGILRESLWASQHDVVALDRGSADGLKPGNVVEVLRPDKMRGDENRSTATATSTASAPAIGTLLVFEALDHEALALVMRSHDAIGVGDLIHSPSTNERPR